MLLALEAPLEAVEALELLDPVDPVEPLEPEYTVTGDVSELETVPI